MLALTYPTTLLLNVILTTQPTNELGTAIGVAGHSHAALSTAIS